MCKDKKISLKGSSLGSKVSVPTNRKVEITIEKTTIHVLEMEDVLFHLGSCVMMPEAPEGKSSSDGREPNKNQKKATGIRALALVFKQNQVAPDSKMLILGHTDSSGGIADNYKLSELRAKDVLYLLKGNRDKWAATSEKKQRVEDYKQILQWAADTYGWDTSPGKIDNTWSDKTEKALTNFITLYNFSFAFKPLDDPMLDEKFVDRVKKDSKKALPIELWKAVFCLYEAELSDAVCGQKVPDESFKKIRAGFSFVVDDKEYLACGESFPVDSKYKDNYRSQKNRRVEILFFGKDDILKLDCPSTKTKVHTDKECPLRNKDVIQYKYIKPEDFFVAVYHIQLDYFDKIHKKVKQIPSGIQFKAWKKGSTEIKGVRTKYADGVYEISVPGITHSPREADIHVTFETKDNWIFTKDDKTEPVMLPNKQMPFPITKENLAKEKIEDQMKYYDPPLKWDSRNWQCKLDTSDGDFAKMNKMVTTKKKPIIFSLDAIVLINKNGTQDIKDTKYNTGTKTETAVKLDNDSRISLMYVDHADKYNLKIHKPHSDAKHYSGITFTRNIIYDLPTATCRIVYFNNHFYDVSNKRSTATEQDITDPNKQFLVGARAAIYEYSFVHVVKTVCVNLNNGTPPSDYAQKWCGNYELHYFDQCGILDNKPLSYLMIYWNCRIKVAATHPASANMINNWHKDGMVNSMVRSNRPYLIITKSGDAKCQIRPYHYYESKINDHNGKHKCMVEITSDDIDWMLPETAKFRDKSYDVQPGYYGTDNVKEVDGVMAKPLMCAHEMGHATGCFDDYRYSLTHNGHSYSGIPRFKQDYSAMGGPYNLDAASRMRYCRMPHMRNIWHFVNWFNDDAKTGKPLDPFLKGSVFKMKYTFKDPSTNADRTIELDLTKSKYRDTCKPSYVSAAFNQFGNGAIELDLYCLGGGETAESLISGQTFDGVLCVTVRIAVKFVNYNSNAQRHNWVKNKVYNPFNDLNKKFYVTTASANDFKKTLLVFTPYFDVYTGANAPATAHFAVIMNDSNASDISTSGQKITVKKNVDGIKIVRYVFGLATNSTAALVEANFNKIATWIGGNSVANATFTVEDI